MARRKKPRLSPAEHFRIVEDPAATRLWPPAQVKQERKRLRRLKRRLYGRPEAVEGVGGYLEAQCCSHEWADDAWQRGVAYPPPADTPAAKMHTCPRCKADVPAAYLTTSGHCQDCRYETTPTGELMGMQGSASVIDYHQLRGHRERFR